jgi:hypothetical protein
MRIHNLQLASLVTGVAICVGANAVAGSGTLPFEVTYESEGAGVQNSTSTFYIEGIETFDEQTATGPENNTSSNGVASGAQTFTADFGLPGELSGTYSNVQVASYGTYGGAGGTGNFAVAPQYTSYTLTLSANPTDFPNGITYFGFWLSALDSGNYVTFYDGSTKLFTFDPADVIAAVDANPDSSDYYGNPNYKAADPAFGSNSDSGEPFIFLNFYATGGTQFTSIVFSQEGGGGYESDNQTVGEWKTMSGTQVPLMHSTVPEPAAWALMLIGVGAVGAVLRQRRRAVMAAA